MRLLYSSSVAVIQEVRLLTLLCCAWSGFLPRVLVRLLVVLPILRHMTHSNIQILCVNLMNFFAYSQYWL